MDNRRRPLPNMKPIIDHVSAMQTQLKTVDFDPREHLLYKDPSAILRMGDIGYAENTGVSPVAVSMPFQLFSSDAIQQMRSEIFQDEVIRNCSYSSNIAACQLRGYAKRYAPFTYNAWRHPDTLAIISRIAGVDLIPWSDYEIAHINFSVKTDEQSVQELAVFDKEKLPSPGDDKKDKPVVGWHTDSYPFVCVLMLSDCKDMVGGETALRTADGEIIKIRSPQQGCAVVMQGRYITHQALRALGTKERITAVTSFRPRSAMVKDDTVLTTVRGISNLSELYFDFAEYRLEIMEERIRKEREGLAARRESSADFDTLAHKKFLQKAVAFLKHTNDEIVEEHKVIPGLIPEVDIPDVVVGAEDDESA